MFNKNKEQEQVQQQGKIQIKQPPILFSETQDIIKEIEKKLDAPLITYYNSAAGSVCGNDPMGIYEQLKGKKYKKLYIYIKSDGGSGIAALKIVSILRDCCDELIALVPSNCASAATMMALGANEIIMGPLAFLTSVDTSLRHELSPVTRNNDLANVSMDELNRVIKLWKDNEKAGDENAYKSLYNYIHPLVFGAVDRASSLSLKICKEILRYHFEDEERINTISQKLNSGYPAHDYPILFREASEIGLHVKKMSDELHDLLQDLTELYSEMGQRTFTDFDANNYHDNNIANIIEMVGTQIYFQVDKDWFYRAEEQRWIVLNDESSWRKNELLDGKLKNTIYYI
ncbi:SDH family Clp fold serine proteinase [Campylobacter geochelonis]|uniref:SDH family Clp fold serine proteinase n=1 Tax=Campylobacter geochelonis TaxID=1780362 RepID=UPI000770B5D9|nr:hypothetical protein [Campylobacter geochelonis]CZE48796.1 R2.LlaJI [Campylobacter geochelonis]